MVTGGQQPFSPYKNTNTRELRVHLFRVFGEYSVLSYLETRYCLLYSH